MASDVGGLDALARLLPSLGLIVGALLLVRRYAQRGRGGPGSAVRVLARAGVAKGAVVAVVQVGDRRLLLGATEQRVNVLSELEPTDTLDAGGATPHAAQDSAADPTLTRSVGWRAAVNPDDRPWIGLIDRLRQLTVRTQRGGPVHDLDA